MRPSRDDLFDALRWEGESWDDLYYRLKTGGLKVSPRQFNRWRAGEGSPDFEETVELLTHAGFLTDDAVALPAGPEDLDRAAQAIEGAAVLLGDALQLLGVAAEQRPSKAPGR